MWLAILLLLEGLVNCSTRLPQFFKFACKNLENDGLFVQEYLDKLIFFIQDRVYWGENNNPAIYSCNIHGANCTYRNEGANGAIVDLKILDENSQRGMIAIYFPYLF